MLSIIGQLIFDGLAMGLVYVILAAGLILIINVSRILFIAYGQFYMIGAYAVWYGLNLLRLPYFFALPVGVLTAAILGMLSYILIFQRVQRKGGQFLQTIMAALGLSLIIGQGGLVIFGTLWRSIPPVFPGIFEVFGIIMVADKVALMGLGLTVTLFLFWVYEKTNIGRAMRTVSFLPEAASLQGVNVNRVYIVTFGIGAALAGFAGGIMAPSYGINPAMGNTILLSVLLMTMLGGLGSLMGAVAGGLVVGMILSFGQFFIGGTVQIVLFLIIGVVIYFRPGGLVGRLPGMGV